MDMQSTDTKNETDKVCIIGAGSSGLAAAKTFAERGIPFDCLEREMTSEDCGTRPLERASSTTPPISSRPANTRASRITRCQRSIRPPQHREALAYLRDYAQNFGILDRIQFNTPVERVERTDEGWLVRIAGARPRLYRRW